MAKYVDDLGYSKRNPFSPTRMERRILRQDNRAIERRERDCLSPIVQGSENLNFSPENPILARVSALGNANPTSIYWKNTTAARMDFVLFNANINYNVPRGGFSKPGDNGQSNDYQTWVGDGWTGTEPPYNPDRSGQTYQDLQYQTIENPILINSLFFSSKTIGLLLKSDVEIKYRDGNGNFQVDHKRLVLDPYMRTGNATLCSPITVMIDGFASITIKDVPVNNEITTTIYPSRNIESVDCIGGNADSMLV
tara:strand:- start:3847 stop:4602 length:756 start_codon:yes stop_codon:yes gene_type:complete